jgi:CheY-like chemotaxis protein
MRGIDLRELSIIDRQVGHLIRLVDDLLDISRITRGKIELRKGRLELAQPVLRGLEMAAPLIEQRRQQIDFRVPPEGLPVIGDPDRLAQIVSNLVTNACKYSEPGSRVTLFGERRDERVVLRVFDQGIGLPPEMLDRIFDLFVQEPQAIDRSKGGLGLGLAIVRSLVGLHGGTVYGKSAGPGRGSELVVELPLAPEEGIMPDESAVEPPRTRERTPGPAPLAARVLVIDDNQDAAESIAELLGELGHQVVVAHDATSALRLARQLKPNVCLVDIGLPGMDGYELARQLRASGDLAAGARLVALTGYGRDPDRRLSFEAGFDNHVVKPVSLETLSQVMLN